MAQKRFPKGHGHLLKDEILRATAALLDETGDADAISIRTIASRVGRTTPAIYEHFQDRHQLLQLAALSVLNEMATKVSAELADEPDFRSRLRRRGHAYVAFARLHPEPYRLLFMDRRAESMLSIDELLQTAGMHAVQDDLRAAHAQGRVAFDDLQLVGLTLWTSLHGIASLWVAHPTLQWPPNLVDQLLDELADGLVPRTKTGRRVTKSEQ
jgi:AcrR family transcriptional regulator